MYQIIKVEPQLAKAAKVILEDVGVDLDTVVKMTLKRVVRDGNISFLMNAPSYAVPERMMPVVSEPEIKQVPAAAGQMASEDPRMSKNLAISLFSAQGIRFNRNVTFASKNKSAYNYWANPYFFALNKDWYLILNDWVKRELYLFLIPAGSIHPQRMVARGDMQDKIDLQFAYNDPTFTDNRSKISFAPYMIKKIQY